MVEEVVDLQVHFQFATGLTIPADAQIQTVDLLTHQVQIGLDILSRLNLILACFSLNQRNPLYQPSSKTNSHKNNVNMVINVDSTKKALAHSYIRLFLLQLKFPPSSLIRRYRNQNKLVIFLSTENSATKSNVTKSTYFKASISI